MKKHRHSAQHTTTPIDGKYTEVCDCGATRIVIKGKPEPWHTCVLCTHPYGLHASVKK